MKLRSLLPALFACAIVSAPALARAQMPATGFVVDARLAGGVTISGSPSSVVLPSLTFGYRLIDRLQVGLGFGLFRFSSGAPGALTFTNFEFEPMASFDILKSKDNKVAWYGKAGLPLGAQVQGGAADRSLFLIGYDLAVGTRFTPHPNVAFAVEGGLTGQFIDPDGRNGSGVTTFYGALVGTFYWGR